MYTPQDWRVEIRVSMTFGFQVGVWQLEFSNWSLAIWAIGAGNLGNLGNWSWAIWTIEVGQLGQLELGNRTKIVTLNANTKENVT